MLWGRIGASPGPTLPPMFSTAMMAAPVVPPGDPSVSPASFSTLGEPRPFQCSLNSFGDLSVPPPTPPLIQLPPPVAS